jgi:hypothetical protein
MRRFFLAVSVVGIVLVFNSCLQDTLLFPVEPRISNASMLVVQDPDTTSVDIWTLTISFDYEDGDGDIGGNVSEDIFSDTNNLELTDNRTLPEFYTWPVVTNCTDAVSSVGLRDYVCSVSFTTGRFPIDSVFTDIVSYSRATVVNQATNYTLPNLSIDSRVPSVSGRVTFNIRNVRILPYESSATTQDIAYDLRIQDVAGHWSNTITVTGRLD